MIEVENKNYIDVTEEWLNKENFKKGRVINRNYYVDKEGNKYKVDGKNVVFDPSEDEIETAFFISETFGGNVYLNPKVNVPINVESCDYLWNNQFWDKKNIGKEATSTTRAVDNAVKKHKKQTDYIILDITNSIIEEQNLITQTEKIFITKGREWVKGIIIINNKNVVKIYMKKERG